MEVHMKRVVKYDVYLDILLIVSICATNYLFVWENRTSGNIALTLTHARIKPTNSNTDCSLDLAAQEES